MALFLSKTIPPNKKWYLLIKQACSLYSTTQVIGRSNMAKVRPINETLQKIAIDELNEVPERIPADIEALRTWIKQQPHLNARTDDQILLAFLRGCKFSLEKAKSKIDKYYTLRTKYPEMFRCDDVDGKKFREILRLGVCLSLPTPLHDHGPRIIIIRSGSYPADKYTILEVTQVMQALQEIALLEDDYVNINGFVAIMDLANATMAHFFQMTPGQMKKSTAFSEEALPMRQKAFHFFNIFSGFETIFNIFKPMMSQKQRERLFLHGSNFESLHKEIPKKYLPKEYGGENGTIAEIIAYSERKIDEYREHFKANANYGTNESLRIGTPVDFDSIFGTEGSFRKLDVD